MSDFSFEGREARRAINDYVASEVEFGGAEVEAFKAWTDSCDGVTLSARASVHAGFMHVEQAYSIASGNYIARYPERSPLANAEIHSAIAAADERFASVRSDPLVTAAAMLGRASLPFFEEALTDRPVTNEHRRMQNKSHAQVAGILHDHYKQTHPLWEIPTIHGMLGYMVLARGARMLGCQVMPSPLRCQETSVLANRWHVALYDRSQGSIHKVRFGVDAPTDTIAVLPSLFNHSDSRAGHELGFLASFAEMLTIPPDRVLDSTVEQHVKTATERIQNYIKTRLVPTVPMPDISADPVLWYQTLPAIRSAMDRNLGNRLSRSIRLLEAEHGAGKLSPETAGHLAGMYMEFALSSESLTRRPPGEIVATLRYAQDLAEEARDTLPQQSAKQLQMACLAPALELYGNLVRGSATEDQIDAYGHQLADIAGTMHLAYERLDDKTSAEAKALVRLLQESTVGLLAVTHPEKHYVALPTSPRQHGGQSGIHGYDFTAWRKVEDTYRLGHYKGAIVTLPNVTGRIRQPRVAWEMLILPSAALGQDRPAERFITLRALCVMLRGGQPSATGRKKVKRAQREVWSLLHTATEEW